MDLVLDIAAIEKASRERWNDNWEFREFMLKNVAPQVVDETSQRLNREVSAKIDCTACGNCCRESKPTLSDKEIKKLALAKGIAVERFKIDFTEIEPDGVRSFNSCPCPLLKGKLCSVYTARPLDCSAYPHLDKPDFLGGSEMMIENYRVCPIVFNVYEQMKVELGYSGSPVRP